LRRWFQRVHDADVVHFAGVVEHFVHVKHYDDERRASVGALRRALALGQG
jgi:hypothetical protein